LLGDAKSVDSALALGVAGESLALRLLLACGPSELAARREQRACKRQAQSIANALAAAAEGAGIGHGIATTVLGRVTLPVVHKP